MPLILALVLLFGGGATSIVAQNSLPGDVLYPVKIHVNEGVESMLAFGSKNDAEVNAKQAVRRLEEVEKLSGEGKLSTTLDAEIKANFSKELISFSKHLSDLEESGGTTTALTLKNQLESEFGSHYKAYVFVGGSASSTSSTSSSTPIIFLKVKDLGESTKTSKDKDEVKIGEKKESEENKNRVEISNKVSDDEEDENDEGSDDNKNTATINANVGVSVGTGQTSGQVKSFTMAEVKTHNTTQSCYTVVGAYVYDVTTWIKQHPGGSAAITQMCGRDATSDFNNQHSGQARPEQELASFKIGVLAKQ